MDIKGINNVAGTSYKPGLLKKAPPKAEAETSGITDKVDLSGLKSNFDGQAAGKIIGGMFGAAIGTVVGVAVGAVAGGVIGAHVGGPIGAFIGAVGGLLVGGAGGFAAGAHWGARKA